MGFKKSPKELTSMPRWREGWERLGNVFVEPGEDGGHGNVAAVSLGPESIHVVSVYEPLTNQSTLKPLHYKWWDGQQWHPSLYGWQSLGPPPGGNFGSSLIWEWDGAAPGAFVVGPSRFDVLVTTLTDKAVWRRSWERQWQPWEWLGVPGAGCHVPPAGVKIASARGSDLMLFAVDTAHELHVREPGGQWAPFGSDMTDVPAAVSVDGSRIDAFCWGNDEVLYHRWTAGGSGPWTEWEPFGPDGASPAAGPLQVVSWGPQRIDLFVRVQQNAQMGYIHRSWNGAEWSEWEWVSSSEVLNVRVVSWGAGRLDLFGLRVAGPVVHKWWDEEEGGWYPADPFAEWQPLHGLYFAQRRRPTATTTPGRLDVFNMRLGVVRHKWWTGGVWHPLVPDALISAFDSDFATDS